MHLQAWNLQKFLEWDQEQKDLWSKHSIQTLEQDKQISKHKSKGSICKLGWKEAKKITEITIIKPTEAFLFIDLKV